MPRYQVLMEAHYNQWASVEAANKEEAIEKVYQAAEEYNNEEVTFEPPMFYEYTEPNTWEAEEIEEP